MSSNEVYKCDWTTWWQKMNPVAWRISSWLQARWLLKSLKDLDIKTMLELGGGSGLIARRLSQKLGTQLTLLDNDPEAYRVFQKFSNYGEYIKEDFFNFQTSRRWDLVYSLGVIEHFPKEKRIQLIKIHKNLATKYVLIMVPARSGTQRVIKKILRSPEISFEKLYFLDELKKEFLEAGLEPWRTGKNFAAAWILSKIKNV